MNWLVKIIDCEGYGNEYFGFYRCGEQFIGGLLNRRCSFCAKQQDNFLKKVNYQRHVNWSLRKNKENRRKERIIFIKQLSKEGLSPKEISNFVGLTRAHVRTLLKKKENSF
jgi:hypothetical protein